MKKLIYMMILGCLVYGLGSCDQDIDHPYTGKDRIQFRCFTYNSSLEKRTYTDSLTFSFGLVADSIEIDTAKIVLEFMGKGSDQERTYNISVIPDSTTAIEGVHYGKLEHAQRFRPNSNTDTLRIVVYRENLSTSFRHPETIRLDLKLEPSEDFDLGIKQGLTKKIKMNNYLSEPTWWKGNFNTTLGFYHPKKWKILISFNKDFANQNSCPFDMNDEGREYAKGLSNYLNDIATYDDETGERIYMNELVPQE